MLQVDLLISFSDSTVRFVSLISRGKRISEFAITNKKIFNIFALISSQNGVIFGSSIPSNFSIDL